MNNTLALIIRVANALEAYNNYAFSGLSHAQLTNLATRIVNSDVDLFDIGTTLDEIMAIYYQVDTSYPNMPQSDKLQLAIDTYSINILNTEIDNGPVESTIALNAYSILTVTDDIADGDTIAVDDLVITAVEGGPDYYTFSIGENAEETAANIITAFDKLTELNGILFKKFSYILYITEPTKISISATTPGVAGNGISTVVTTEGTTAFSTTSTQGGVDAVASVAKYNGRIHIDSNNNCLICLNDGWHTLFTQYTSEFDELSHIIINEPVNASAELTVAVVSEGNTIVASGTTLTAIANGAIPTAGQFAVGTTPAETTTSILTALGLMDDELLDFTFALKAATTNKIIFTAKVAGLEGNTLECAVTTAGESAFDNETFSGGRIAYMQTPMDYTQGDLNIQPDVYAIKTTVSTDIELTPLYINAPDNYVFERIELQTPTLPATSTITNVLVKDDNLAETYIDLTQDIEVDNTVIIRAKENIILNKGSVNVYLTGNDPAGTIIKVIFHKVQI